MRQKVWVSPIATSKYGCHLLHHLLQKYGCHLLQEEPEEPGHPPTDLHRVVIDSGAAPGVARAEEIAQDGIEGRGVTGPQELALFSARRDGRQRFPSLAFQGAWALARWPLDPSHAIMPA